MFPQNVLIVTLSLIKLTQGLAQTTKVIGRCHGDLGVVGLVLYGFLLAAIQCLFIVRLCEELTIIYMYVVWRVWGVWYKVGGVGMGYGV